MNKRQARKIAYQIAYRFVQQALEGGGDGREADNDADQTKIDDALDQIAQMLFERGREAKDTPLKSGG